MYYEDVLSCAFSTTSDIVLIVQLQVNLYSSLSYTEVNQQARAEKTKNKNIRWLKIFYKSEDKLTQEVKAALKKMELKDTQDVVHMILLGNVLGVRMLRTFAAK